MMSLLNNLNFQTKLAIPSVAIGILVILLSAYCIRSSLMIAEDNNEIASVFIDSIELGLNADRDLYQSLTATQNFIALMGLGDRNSAAAEKADFEENAQQAYDRMNKMRGLMKGYPEIEPSIATFERDYKAWYEKASQVISLAEKGSTRQAQELNTREAKTLFEILRRHYDVSVEVVKNISEEVANGVAKSTNNQEIILITAMCIVLFAVAASIYLSPKLITVRLNTLINVIDQISQGDGDLRGRLDDRGKDELAVLARAFNSLMGKLQYLIKMIQNDSEELEHTSNSLNGSTIQSERMTSTQNKNLEQIASAVTELSHAVHEVAGNLQSALSETQNARDKATESRTIVDDTVVSVNNLSNSVNNAAQVIAKLADESMNIASVLDVIRGIAEQTNLLALNAAIEAARAGEQGRGFAVVADEVRTLASRTQQSTEDIQRMISGLKGGVEEAVGAMRAGSDQMSNVLAMSETIQAALVTVEQAINKGSEMIYQIASATEQQSSVTDEITKNINTLHDIAQEGIGNIQNTREVADKIDRMSRALAETSGRFCC